MRTALIAAAFILSTLAGPPAMAQSQTLADQETRNRAVIQTAFDAWSAATGGPFDLLADDARWTIVGRSDAAGAYGSRAEFIDKVIAPFNARMVAGIRPTIRRMYADGDTVIVFFDASGQATDGVAYDNTYAWFMRLEDGRVVEVSAFFDSLEFNDLWRRVTPD